MSQNDDDDDSRVINANIKRFLYWTAYTANMSDIGEIKPRRPGSLFAAGIITSVSIVRNRIAEYIQGQSVFYWIDKAAADGIRLPRICVRSLSIYTYA